MNRHTPLPPAVAEIFESVLDRYPAVLPTLERNAPRLSEEEISERVAEKLVAHLMRTVPEESAKARAKEKLKKLGYDIAVGIVSSGSFAALAYAASQITFLDGASHQRSEEAVERQRRFDRFRHRLASGIDAEEDREELKSLDLGLYHLTLTAHLVSEESKAIIADLLDALRDKAENKSLASGS